jgi:hypothetical protein
MLAALGKHVFEKGTCSPKAGSMAPQNQRDIFLWTDHEPDCQSGSASFRR